MNTKTEKPKSFGPKTEKTTEKKAETAKPKIPMPPSYNGLS